MSSKAKSFLTVGQLKQVLAGMSDDAFVFARDRDCISLDKVHVVMPEGCLGVAEIPPAAWKGIRCVNSFDKVYGGEGELDNESKQAIIFCDCD